MGCIIGQVGGADESTPVEDGRYATPIAAGCFKLLEEPCALCLDDIVHRVIANRTRYERRNLKREKKELDYIQTQKQYITEL